jgi:hypothetical protein
VKSIHRVFAITLFVSALFATEVASATNLYPNPGTPNPTTYTFTAASTGDVIAYFAGTGAFYTETVGMLVNGVLSPAGYVLNNHTSAVGQSFDLGQVNAGDTIVFVLDVSNINAFFYSDPSLNTTFDTNGTRGHNHIFSTAYAFGGGLGSIPSGTYVGFEDLPFPGSDFNYFDDTFVFTNVIANAPTTQAPEPATLALLAVGCLGMGPLRRKFGRR